MKGTKNRATIEKEQGLDILRQRVWNELGAMTEAQIAHAKGVSYMVLRHKDGTFSRATDEKQINAAVAAGGEVLQIFTQAPHTPAFMELLTRTFGKPKETVEVDLKAELSQASDEELAAKAAALLKKAKHGP